MSILNCVARFLRRYVFSPESLLVLILAVILYNTVINISPLWKRARVKLRFQADSPVTGIAQGRDKPRVQEWAQTESPIKTSWEEKRENVAVYAIQGRRPHMEDRYKLMKSVNGLDLSLFGIFDGHGGEFAAEFLEKNLFSGLLSQAKDSTTNHDSVNLTQLITKEILNIDSQILDYEKKNTDISGSTALVAMVSDTTLTVANVGDSRGVLCDKDGNTIPISFDHKPHLVKERRRIREAGGFVSYNGVWRVAGILALSRALGDYPLKEKNFIIADPDILTFDLNNLQPRFMILATDGLWDTFTNEEAVEYIKERLDEPHFGAKSIILQAYYRGSLDNITVMVVKFGGKQAMEKKQL